MKNITFLLVAVFCFTLLKAQIITNSDSVSIPAYYTDTIWLDVLVNDYDTDGDSIFVSVASDLTIKNGRYLGICSKNELWDFTGIEGRADTLWYQVQSTKFKYAADYIYIDVINESFDYLDVNNLKARFYAFGNHFWDFNGKAMFYAPQNAQTTSVFCNALWLAGADQAGEQYVAAERYRATGADYWAGPISNVYDSIYDAKWNRIWKLSKSEIDYHIANYSSQGYFPIKDIAEWPAHGDVSRGQSKNIAPFYDANSNGTYEPSLGDYPIIKGDMTLFFVFNDGRGIHGESGGKALGVEICGMAYGYADPQNPHLFNTIFMHYDITNKSNKNYSDAYIGMFTDFDLGYAFDDYVGCDVQNGAYYAYNGHSIDGIGSPRDYGANPPTMGVQFLGGPFIDQDGKDNPKYDSTGKQLCNESINGSNFGDSIIDNERLGMNKFMYFNNQDVNPAKADPQTASEYYLRLKGMWSDSTHMTYGASGHKTLGPKCNFMFPDETDLCNWGTGGLTPVNKKWTEQEPDGLGSAPSPAGDRRGLGASGPFTFNAGETHQLDIAFVYSPSYSIGTIDSLRNRFEVLKKLFEADHFTSYIPDKNFSTMGTWERTERKRVVVLPNPATDRLYIKGLENNNTYLYTIHSIAGQKVGSGLLSNSESLNTRNLNSGLYILTLESEGERFTVKFVKK